MIYIGLLFVQNIRKYLKQNGSIIILRNMDTMSNSLKDRADVLDGSENEAYLNDILHTDISQLLRI
jgi:hypothetical protein